ncbi:MAG: TraB/GumN family protein [Gammaproteobacteria bacterium]
MTISSADGLRARLRRLAATLLLGFLACADAMALDCPALPGSAFDASAPLRHERGLLWRITGPAGAQNVMLGTMHVADPRVLALREASRPALVRSRVFVMEVVLDAAAMATLQRAMFFSDGRSLREVAGPELFAATAAHMQRHGVPAALTESMKPWAAFTTLSLPAGQAGAPLDAILMADASAAGNRVVGLETVDEQVAVFESVAEADQLDMLREVACHYDYFQAEVVKLVDRYAARDLRGLMSLSLKHVDEHRAGFLEALLWRRNERMLERLRPLLDAGGAFVAVGALHLPGPRGLLEQLEQAGYVVERVD